MPRSFRLHASFLLLLTVEVSCQRKRVAVPLPPPPAPSQPTPATTAASPPPPAEEPPATTSTHPEDPSRYQVNKPPQPPPAARRPARTATVPSPAPAATTTPPAPPAPAPAAPKLGDVLSDDEQKQYSASIDQSVAHAQTSLNSLAGKQLNKDQQAEVEQIRNFISQAQSTRNSDPSGAKSFAQRAEVLARDLAATFH